MYSRTYGPQSSNGGQCSYVCYAERQLVCHYIAAFLFFRQKLNKKFGDYSARKSDKKKQKHKNLRYVCYQTGWACIKPVAEDEQEDVSLYLWFVSRIGLLQLSPDTAWDIVDL